MLALSAFPPIVTGACVNAIIFANVASLVSQMSAVSAAHQARSDVQSPFFGSLIRVASWQSRMDEIDRAMGALKLDQVIQPCYHSQRK